MASPPDFGERFHPVRRLGVGGMAEIWLVEDNRTQAVRVAKILPGGGNNQTRDLLRREFEIGRRLDHPNIVRTLGLYGGESHPFLVLEYVPGTDAGVLVGRPMEETVRVFREISRALEYVHEQGVVHRDLKPSNILLDESGRPHITDFGVADVVGPRETDPGLVGGGSRAAVSPQQLDGAAAAVADDLYSFGALIHHVITGSPPLGPNPSDQQIRTVDPQPLTATWPVPPQLRDLVASLLAKDPGRRPRDMAAVTHVFDSILADGAARTTPPRHRPATAGVDIMPPPRTEGIGPISRGVGGADNARAPAKAKPRIWWATAATLTMLVSILAFVVFVLPGMVERPSTPVGRSPDANSIDSGGQDHSYGPHCHRRRIPSAIRQPAAGG